MPFSSASGGHRLPGAGAAEGDLPLARHGGSCRRLLWPVGEGWFDGYGLLQAFRRKARSLGVTYMAAEAAGVEREGDRVTAVLLADGTRIACGAVVNAAGAGGPALARAAGIEIRCTTRSG